MSISIVRRLGSMMLAAVAVFSGTAFANQDSIAGPDKSIRRAVFADGRLWLLDSGGRLSHIAEGGERVDVTTPDPAMELFVQDGHAAIVTCPQQAFAHRTPVERWTVRRRGRDDWETVADIATKGETFVAATSTILLTDSRIIDLAGRSPLETALTLASSGSQAARPKPTNADERFRLGGSVQFMDDEVIDLTEGLPWEAAPTAPSSIPVPAHPTPLTGRPVGAVLVTPQHVFVGYDAGEWGGGLQRIDRMTGVVSDIDDVDGGPVKGIATIPWKPDCIAVAIGLIHMGSSGRIVEVCDITVRLLYTHVIPAPDGQKQVFSFAQTTAFFGLQRRDGELLAIGHDGLYQIGEGDRVQQIPFPTFKRAGTLGVSFERSGAVLVLITRTQGLSQNNGALMLVSR